jgi:DNA-binding transcriptional MerR regulator
MQSYRIGEFARKVGVSPDLLKYQEEFAILDPEQSESNYRYYRFSQAGRVYASLFYRNLGFSLREISELLNESSRAQIMQSLSERKAGISHEIQHLDACRSAIEELERIDRRLSEPQSFYIEDLPAYVFLPHAQGSDFLDDERILPILAEWMAWFPAVFSCQRIPLAQVGTLTIGEEEGCMGYGEDGEGAHERDGGLGEAGRQEGVGTTEGVRADDAHVWGLMIPSELARLYDLPLDAPVEHIAAGRYLLYYQAINLHYDATGPTLPRAGILSDALLTAKHHDLTVTGDILHRIIFHSQEEDHYLNSVVCLPL